MKHAVSLIVCLSALSAQAGVLSDKITREIMDKTHINNGSIQIERYNVPQFNLGLRISEIKEINEMDVCKYNVVVNRGDAIKKIRAFNDNEMANLLDRLHKRGKLKTAILNEAIHDEEQGSACQQAQIEIYANDGEVLKIDYQTN